MNKNIYNSIIAAWTKHMRNPDQPVYQDFEERYQDEGNFTFEATGFTFTHRDQTMIVEWAEITSILGYKADAMTTDTVCIEIFTANTSKNIRITEETPGWYQFLLHLRATFPEISQTWEQETAIRPFKTDLTLLYDRHNRSLEEVIGRD